MAIESLKKLVKNTVMKKGYFGQISLVKGAHAGSRWQEINDETTRA